MFLQFFNLLLAGRYRREFPETTIKHYLDHPGALRKLIKVKVDLEFDSEDHMRSYLKHVDTFSFEFRRKIVRILSQSV